MQFKLPQVSFFGNQWSARGLSPDPKKIVAVKCMEVPQDMEMMKSFLGLVNYLNRFSPHLAELSEPLRQICRQNMEFELTESVHVAFSLTKEEFPRTLHFNISILTVPPLYKLMHLRKDLVLYFYKIPDQ